jgi:WD40 repeat protein
VQYLGLIVSVLASADDAAKPKTASVDAKLVVHRDGVFSIQSQPGGDLLCSAGRDRTVGLWKIGDDSTIKRLEGHTNQVLRVAFHPKGTHVASGGADNVIHVWNVATKKSERVLKGHTNWVCDVAFDATGERLVSAGADGMVKIWSVADGKELSSFKAAGGETWAAAFLPNGDVIAGGKDGALRRFSPTAKEATASSKRHAKDLYTISLTKKGRAASVGGDGLVVLYDEELKPIKSWKAHEGQAYALAFLSDGRLATCGEDKTVRVWDVESQRELSRGTAHKNAVYGIASLRDGRVVSAGQERTIHIWKDMPTLTMAAWSRETMKTP